MDENMINYGYILKCKEKDNTSPFLGATYLFSNVGDLVKCYGRSIRFPQDAKLYQAEMKLALGDIIMQCRLIENEHVKKEMKLTNFDIRNTSMLREIQEITESASEIIKNRNIEQETRITLLSCYAICTMLNWNFEEVSHIGFLHVCERFEQFEREGWQ
jgi:hypothetical protein